jgi:hypothetical protein
MTVSAYNYMLVLAYLCVYVRYRLDYTRMYQSIRISNRQTF